MVNTLDECIRLARSYPVPDLTTVVLKEFEIELHIQKYYSLYQYEALKKDAITRTETYLKAYYPVIGYNQRLKE